MNRCGAKQNPNSLSFADGRVWSNEQREARPHVPFSCVVGGVLPRPSTAIPKGVAGYNGERIRRYVKGGTCQENQ